MKNLINKYKLRNFTTVTNNMKEIEHKCRQEGEKIKCINLIDMSTEEKTELKEKEKHLYTDVGSFRKDNLSPETLIDQQEINLEKK